jgi:hypothetical protein
MTPPFFCEAEIAPAGCFDFCCLSDLSQKGKELINLVNTLPKNTQMLGKDWNC